ncbi:hypothetical protein MPER_05260 [Moniliophthora perniciosa FA553]|nr:hypothetical protein MPER_05260 [Moniliophthora perniciosa FA553]
MGDVFYAQYTKLFQPTNTTAWSDIEKQFKLIYDNTLQASNDTNYIGLLYHGYDYSHTASWASPDRGHCPEIWDRALGWYMMALVDILEFIPTSNSAYSTIIKILQSLVPPLIKAADPASGVWCHVRILSLKGVRLGYITDTDGSVVAARDKAFDS